MPSCFGCFFECGTCYLCPWAYNCEDETDYLEWLYSHEGYY